MRPRRPVAPPQKPIGEVRIIGGQLKRSKLGVIDRPGLRPTPDRVRETLFNWLGPGIVGLRVLDLCAGTGVLGFEALSRGAAAVHFNEPDRELAARIAADAERLKVADRITLTREPAQALLSRPPAARYDGVFVDPPYALDLWPALLAGLPGWLRDGAFVYLEHPRERSLDLDPARWRPRRSAQAGQIAYHLLDYAEASASVVGSEGTSS
ncbi:MAG: 16S rRNA (guanine(966)-N(2))-methyltransferase RsmD [Lysobacterales bacterium]